MGAKNLARLNVKVFQADKIGINGGKSSNCCLLGLQNPYIVSYLVPTCFRDLRNSFDIVIE